MLVEQVLGAITPILALAAFIIPFTGKILVKDNKLYLFIIALTASTFTAISSTIVFYTVLRDGKPLIYKYGGWPPHFGIVYEVDLFGALLGVFTSWVFLAVVLYSHWYSHHVDDPTWYYTLLIGLEIGLIGCLYTGDAFNLFVMIEVLSISAYGLVAYHRDKSEAVEAAAKYALIGAVATTFYFTAVVLMYSGYGSLNMAFLSRLSRYSRLPEITPSLVYITMFSIALSIWMFTYKSAIFPNHFWLPDAHPEAPTPISAALSGLVVNIGAYAIGRFLYTMFGQGSSLVNYREVILVILFTLGILSGFIGAFMMMAQRDVKRLLAYSTISHMGIVYIGLSTGFLVWNEKAVGIAVMGAIVHIIAHGVAKALLFMASGVLIDASGSRDLEEMKGIGRYYPLTSLALIIGFLNLAGFIPFIGFYSKLLIVLGYVNAGLVIGSILIIAISALSIPGYLKAISALVFATGKRPENLIRARWIEILLLSMAISLLILGVLFQYIVPVFETTTNSLITTKGVEEYVNRALREIPVELLEHIPTPGG